MDTEDKNANPENIVFKLSNKDNYKQTLEDPIVLIQLSYVKIIHYYIEYISQITDKEDNMFFNLTLKDAIVYIYTKTIYDIDEETRQGHSLLANENAILEIVTNFTDIYGKLSLSLANSDDFKLCENNKKKEILQKVREYIETYIIHQYKYDIGETETIKKMKLLLIDCENQPNQVFHLFEDFFNSKNK